MMNGMIGMGAVSSSSGRRKLLTIDAVLRPPGAVGRRRPRIEHRHPLRHGEALGQFEIVEVKTFVGVAHRDPPRRVVQGP